MSSIRMRLVSRSIYRDIRPLATSSVRRLPRAPVRVRAFGGSPAPPSNDPSSHSIATDDVNTAKPPNEVEDPQADDSPPSFPSVVTALSTPGPPSSPLAPEHHILFNHLATSFLASNQPCASSQVSYSTRELSPNSSLVVSSSTISEDTQQRWGPLGDDPVLALVCPFEGGEVYISDAVNEVASHLSADVLRLDLALGVGLDGISAPLNEIGIHAPPLPPSSNPLFQNPSSSSTSETSPIQDEEQHEEGEEENMPNVIRLPMLTIGGGGMGNPFAVPSSHHRGGSPANEEWISFFSAIINILPSDSDVKPKSRRIILLESVSAMSGTFEIWWSSLLEAVRRRRREGAPTATNGRNKSKSRTLPPLVTQPTTIVLSCPPSLLLPHTTEMRPRSDLEEVESQTERVRSVFEAMGASVASIHVEGSEKGDEKLWWSSEERDMDGRRRKDDRRLRAILGQGPSSLLPPLGISSGGTPNSGISPHPLMDILTGRTKKKDDMVHGTSGSSLVWKTLPIIPGTRDPILERRERTLRRQAVNAALVSRAVAQLGASLDDPLAILGTSGTAPWRGRRRRSARRKIEGDPEWSESVIAWDDAVDLASTAVGRAAVVSKSHQESLSIKWADIQEARVVTADHERYIDETASQYLTVSQSATAKTETETQRAPTVDKTSHDSVIDAVKKSKDLSRYEKRLLPCVVDAQKLEAASFSDVHMPYKTIDGIRTVISLPLLFPEAFQGGILKDHGTTGALLFGPPGTGKTLLARAIAAESGARMIAIQPSDVNDMWVGEGEKLVKALFSLARRLSPCVIFIDEVDSLFGARASRDSSGGAKAHHQILTEFMQEMDGLSSAISNREKRVVVVGATNRPFDLDDAILRRLPRRLLVDLPTLDDRKAILKILLRNETLADDVSLDSIAEKTEGFSGSDLKHLCVAAALAAVKDIVNVPWKSAVASHPRDPSTIASPPSEDIGQSDPKEDERLTVKEEPQRNDLDLAAPEMLPRPIDATLEQARIGLTGEDLSPTSLVQQSKVSSSASTSVSGQVSTQAATEDVQMDKSPAPKIDSSSQAAPLVRILSEKHFTVALGEIRPSSSEEGTLPALRKWAEQYGEGGTRRGKKTGFGKGFGFGDDVHKTNRHSGYGRVTEDE